VSVKFGVQTSARARNVGAVVPSRCRSRRRSGERQGGGSDGRRHRLGVERDRRAPARTRRPPAAPTSRLRGLGTHLVARIPLEGH